MLVFKAMGYTQGKKALLSARFETFIDKREKTDKIQPLDWFLFGLYTLSPILALVSYNSDLTLLPLSELANLWSYYYYFLFTLLFISVLLLALRSILFVQKKIMIRYFLKSNYILFGALLFLGLVWDFQPHGFTIFSSFGIMLIATLLLLPFSMMIFTLFCNLDVVVKIALEFRESKLFYPFVISIAFLAAIFLLSRYFQA